MNEHTRANHPPRAPVPAQTPLGLPVYRSSTFAFGSAQEAVDIFAGAPGYSYSRTDNPTCDAFAAAVAALEGVRVDRPLVGQSFASGMAASSAVLMALTGAGSHVVAARDIYGGSYALLTSVLARFGVETSFVDMTDLDAVRRAVRDSTAVVWAETLSNPTMTVVDLPALAAVAREAGAALVVDSTFASPAMCRPLEHGADVVLHSATKYIGGHSDATGGVAVGDPELMARVRSVRIDLGGSLAPDEAFLLHRGIATLPLRVDRQCRTALAVASALEEHASVVRVDHPGLASHRSNALARKLFDEGRYGAVVTVTLHGGREAAMALCDRLRLVHLATSLGGTASKAIPVAVTTHKQLDSAQLAAAGIAPSTVRISIGLEDPQDLIDDLQQALA